VVVDGAISRVYRFESDSDGPAELAIAHSGAYASHALPMRRLVLPCEALD